ncbi:MAG: 1-acyl-sn-glycerol-3-phosphate acyltransferase [Cellvibrionaceae bacterium]
MPDINADFYNSIPDEMPRMHSEPVSKFYRWVFNRIGWRFIGDIPKIKKAIVIVAPHTSNIDFFIACFAKFALQLKASYIMKKEAFFWPFKTFLMGIGGIPIDRRNPAKIVTQVKIELNEKEKIWVVITPEGTRKKVSKYKTGFVRIAHAANVPIIVVGFDYQKKAVVFSKVVEATGDHDKDANELYHLCRDSFVARHPENQ